MSHKKARRGSRGKTLHSSSKKGVRRQSKNLTSALPFQNQIRSKVAEPFVRKRIQSSTILKVNNFGDPTYQSHYFFQKKFSHANPELLGIKNGGKKKKLTILNTNNFPKNSTDNFFKQRRSAHKSMTFGQFRKNGQQAAPPLRSPTYHKDRTRGAGAGGELFAGPKKFEAEKLGKNFAQKKRENFKFLNGQTRSYRKMDFIMKKFHKHNTKASRGGAGSMTSFIGEPPYSRVYKKNYGSSGELRSGKFFYVPPQLNGRGEKSRKGSGVDSHENSRNLNFDSETPSPEKSKTAKEIASRQRGLRRAIAMNTSIEFGLGSSAEKLRSMGIRHHRSPNRAFSKYLSNLPSGQKGSMLRSGLDRVEEFSSQIDSDEEDDFVAEIPSQNYSPQAKRIAQLNRSVDKGLEDKGGKMLFDGSSYQLNGGFLIKRKRLGSDSLGLSTKKRDSDFGRRRERQSSMPNKKKVEGGGINRSHLNNKNKTSSSSSFMKLRSSPKRKSERDLQLVDNYTFVMNNYRKTDSGEKGQLERRRRAESTRSRSAFRTNIYGDSVQLASKMMMRAKNKKEANQAFRKKRANERKRISGLGVQGSRKRSLRPKSGDKIRRKSKKRSGGYPGRIMNDSEQKQLKEVEEIEKDKRKLALKIGDNKKARPGLREALGSLSNEVVNHT